MNRKIYFVLFLLFAFFSYFFFKTAYRDHKISIGKIAKNVLVVSKGNCGRGGGTIKVKYESKIYTLGIGRNDCINGKYKIGDQIIVLYGEQYDYFILKDMNTISSLYLSIAFFFLPIYCLYKLIRKP